MPRKTSSKGFIVKEKATGRTDYHCISPLFTTLSNSHKNPTPPLDAKNNLIGRLYSRGKGNWKNQLPPCFTTVHNPFHHPKQRSITIYQPPAQLLPFAIKNNPNGAKNHRHAPLWLKVFHRPS